MTDLLSYVKHFQTSLNVSLMTKFESNSDSNFLVANFYAQSKFQEDCLINMSIEKVNYTPYRGEGEVQGKQEIKIAGLIRLRAKTEGMALCVGEKCKLVR